ncbi:uncharacterized protein BJ212DRAFT_1303705 [Suillus subaureus]|uniref:Uncharacterized protein n=1 Tax=Suillus subaureus TaxID=48587 RepID=A0A9P7DYD2_9AGAM|nr:uncharacterized protein BJ212DRAFT_1303705 [Suillus subaureus]KAG1806182.1 hypothetical protein BJ212DRAFT_1303705 [Suillus subaureus]
MACCGPKPWTTVEEDVFLKALLPEFIRAQHLKMFVNVWADTFCSFFYQWPKCTCLYHNSVPVEGDLTPDQLKIVKLAIAEHRIMTDQYMGEVNELKESQAPQEVKIKENDGITLSSIKHKAKLTNQHINK